MTAPARSPRRMSPERRRAHLVATALELYRRLPPDQVSIEDVARAADVSRPLVYRYFASAAQLHAAALEAVVDELLARLVISPGGDLAADLHAALDVFLDVVVEHAAGYVALLRSGSVVASGHTHELVERVRRHIAAMIVERAGGGDPSPEFLLAVRGWIAVAETTCVSWLQDRPMPRERFRGWLAAQLVAMLGVGVAAGRQGEPS